MQSHRLFALVALAGLAAIGAPPAAGQTSRPEGALSSTATGTLTWLPAGQPSFTVDDVTGWLQEMIPAVEDSADKTFERSVDIQITNRSGLRPMLVADELPLVQTTDAALTTNAAITVATIRADLRLPAILAFGQDATIFVPLENIAPLFDAAGVPAAERRDVMKLAIAHELTRLLIGQHTGLLDQLRDPRTTDEAMAQQGLVEGFAGFVRRDIATTGDLAMADSFVQNILSLTSIEPAPDELKTRYGNLHESARVFVEVHNRIGKMLRLWGILGQPPLSRDQLRAPMTYGDVVQMTMSHERLFRGLRDIALTPTWGQRSRVSTAADVGRSFSPLGTEVSNEIQASVANAWSMMATNEQRSLFTIGLFEMIDEAAAGVFIDHVESLAETQFSQLRQLGGQRGIAVENRSLDRLQGLTADQTRLFHCSMQSQGAAGANALPDILIVCATRGRYVAHMIGTRAPIMDDRAGRLLQTVLDRAEQDDAMVPVEPREFVTTADRALLQFRDLVEGTSWSVEQKTVTFESLLRLVGTVEDSRAALRIGFTTGNAYVFTQDSAAGARALMATLIEMQGPEIAMMLQRAIAASPERVLDRFKAAQARVTPTEYEDRSLDSGIALSVRGFEVILPESPKRSAHVYIAQQGPYVLHMLDLADALDPASVEAGIETVFSALP